ncbi:9992_t:CDS:1, partial [Gigaspora rosea]
IKILKTVRSAIPLINASSETASYLKPKLLIVERMIDEQTQSFIYQMDMLMMCLCNGKERTKSDMEKLLDKSGWKFTKITPCRGGFSVIEAVPL